MKEKQILSKKFISFIAASVLLFSIPFVVNEVNSSKLTQNQTLKSGTNTCFTRVTQSFTALMIQDLNSSYLSKDFLNMTGECFNELNKQFDAVYATGFMSAKKSLNKLVSDLHWFHEKTSRLKQMSADGAITLSTSSNILNKYSELESLKIDFLDGLDGKSQSLATYKNLSIGFAFAGFIMMLTLVGLTVKDKYQDAEFIYGINEYSREMLEKNELNGAKIDRFTEHVMAKLGAPFFYELLNRYQVDLIESQMDRPVHAADVQAKVMQDIEEDTKAQAVQVSHNEITEFGKILNVLMDRLDNKAFTHGIIFDTDLGEDFNVSGSSESIEQLIFSLINFGIENSLNHNQGRKITIRSKALGGIAYFKIRVANHLYNPDELEALNNQNSELLASNMNLMMINEIASDLKIGVSCKNIVNDQSFTGSELEVVFNRVMPEVKADRKVSVMKGSKKDIQRMLSEV
jgi:hypothetical protein